MANGLQTQPELFQTTTTTTPIAHINGSEAILQSKVKILKNNYNFHMLNLQILKLIKIHIFIFFVSIYWTSVLYKHNSDWQSYWYDLSVCSNGLFTLNEISGSDTTSDSRQEAVASGHSGDNTDRGDRGAGDLEPAVKQWHEQCLHQHIYTDQTWYSILEL